MFLFETGSDNRFGRMFEWYLKKVLCPHRRLFFTKYNCIFYVFAEKCESTYKYMSRWENSQSKDEYMGKIEKHSYSAFEELRSYHFLEMRKSPHFIISCLEIIINQWCSKHALPIISLLAALALFAFHSLLILRFIFFTVIILLTLYTKRELEEIHEQEEFFEKFPLDVSE